MRRRPSLGRIPVAEVDEFIFGAGRAIKPGRRHRNAYLAKHKPDLLVQLVRQGILYGRVEEPERVPVADEGAWGESSDFELPA